MTIDKISLYITLQIRYNLDNSQKMKGDQTMSGGLIYITGYEPSERDTMYLNIRDWELTNNESFFNEEKIKDTLNTLIADGYTGIDELYDLVDLPSHLSDLITNESLKKQCLLIRENTAWFYTTNGKTRYYSKRKNGTDNDTIMTCDLTDLFMVYWKLATKRATFERLASRFPYAESEFAATERARYSRNYAFLDSYEVTEDSVLDEADITILTALSNIAMDKLSDISMPIEGKAYFFASLVYVNRSVMLVDDSLLSRTMLANRINRLATLGFIRKIGENRINEKQFKKSKEITTLRKSKHGQNYNNITYYQIENFETCIRTAIKHDLKLKKKKVRLDQITEEEVIFHFGSTWAKRVFPMKTRKKPQRYTKETKDYTKAFYTLLKKQGYITKQQLSHLAHKKLADRLWTKLVNRTTGIAKRLSKQLNEFLNIEQTGAVLMSYQLFHTLYTFVLELAKKGEEVNDLIIEQEMARLDAYIREPIYKRLWHYRVEDRGDAVC